jgi:hypothetical protein
MAMTEAPPTRRRWYQFTLRGVMVLVALLALPLAWHMRTVNGQRSAVATVLERGGRVTYDYQLTISATGNIVGDDKGKPSRLASWIGIDHVQKLRDVDLRAVDVTDDDMRVIAQARSLEGIDFGRAPKRRTKIPDEVLQRMQSLPDVRRLNFSYTDFDDKQVEYILCHKNLRLLQLSHTLVTDDGLERLTGLAELDWLDLTDTPMTDRGLEHLAKLKNMKWLIARGKQVTAEGAQRLRTALPNATIIYP